MQFYSGELKDNRISFHLSKVYTGHLQATITKPSKQYFALFTGYVIVA
jgi:hypothetical protein